MSDTMNIDLKSPTDQARLMSPLQFDDLVHAAMEQFLPDSCVREMWRVGTEYDTDHDQLLVIRITYATRFQQVLADVALVLAPVNTVTVTGELVDELPGVTDAGPPVALE